MCWNCYRVCVRVSCVSGMSRNMFEWFWWTLKQREVFICSLCLSNQKVNYYSIHFVAWRKLKYRTNKSSVVPARNQFTFFFFWVVLLLSRVCKQNNNWKSDWCPWITVSKCNSGSNVYRVCVVKWLLSINGFQMRPFYNHSTPVLKIWTKYFLCFSKYLSMSIMYCNTLL